MVKRKFFTWPSDLFVTLDVSDVQNCGKTRILRLTLATRSWFRACRTLKTVVKRKFFTSPRNPFVTSCVSNAQNGDKTHMFHVAEQPFRYFVRVGCSKLWQNGRFWPDWIGLRSKTEVKWTFWTTEVQWGVVVFVWWCLCGVCVVLFVCGVFVVVFLWWCSCGCVFVVVFVWWCVCVVVFLRLWRCFLRWCGCVCVVVFLWWSYKFYWSDACLKRLSSNIAQSSAEVIAVFKDCHQTSPKVLLKRF